MFSRLKNFLHQHKKKLILGGATIGVIILVTRYAERKIREWQERETRDFLDRTRKQHHFESTERTCNLTVFSLAPKVRDAVLKHLDSDVLTLQLRNKPPNKVELWEELKVLAFTRACVLVYSYAMLVVVIRIQVNLIGGSMFSESVKKVGDCANSESEETVPQLTSSLQQRYLTMCNYFIENGVQKLCELFEQKVKRILKNISLKHPLTLQDIEQIFWAVQTSVSNEDPIKNLPQFLIGSERGGNSDTDGDLLNNMISDTIDLLESEEVISLSSSCVSQGFGHIVDRIADYFVPVQEKSSNAMLTSESHAKGTMSQSQNGKNENSLVVISANGVNNIQKTSEVSGLDLFIHPNKLSMPMAKLIPVVNGLTHPSKSDGPDPWVKQLILMDRLKVLGANVYEAFSHK